MKSPLLSLLADKCINGQVNSTLLLIFSITFCSYCTLKLVFVCIDHVFLLMGT